MHTVAGVAVVDARGRLLVQPPDTRRTGDPGGWGLPGAVVARGDDPAVAAAQVLAEQAGLRLPPERLVDLGRTRHFADHRGEVEELATYVVPADGTDDLTGVDDRWFLERAALFDRPLTAAARLQLPDVLDSPLYRERFGTPASRCFAGVLLVDGTGAVLLQERDEHPVIDPDRWGLAGGHLEPGEDFLAGAVRELGEETGVELDPSQLTLHGEYRVDHRAAYGSIDRMRVFAAPTRLADADIDCREGRRIVFVDPVRARGLDLTAAASVVLPAFLGSALHARLRESAAAPPTP